MKMGSLPVGSQPWAPVGGLAGHGRHLGLQSAVFQGPLLRRVYAPPGWDGLSFRGERTRAREQIRSLFRSVELGQSQDEVKKIIGQRIILPVTPDTRSPEMFRVETPPELGASNWVVYLGFSAEGKLKTVHVRCADSANRRPSDAPQDRGL